MDPGPLSNLRRRVSPTPPLSAPRGTDRRRNRRDAAADDSLTRQRQTRARERSRAAGERLRPERTRPSNLDRDTSGGQRSRRSGRRPRHVREWPLVRWTGGLLGELLRRAGDRPDAARFWGAVLIGCLGAVLLGIAGNSDNYLHRGVETSGTDEFVIHPADRAHATNVDLLAMEIADLPILANQLRDQGFRYIRFPVAWAAIEPEPGQFSWTTLDTALEALTEADLTAVVTLANAPNWARAEGGNLTPDAPPADATDFAGFVAILVARYGVNLSFLQVWDRPNDPQHWGGATDPLGYGTLLGEAANAARAVNPDIHIVLGELTPNPDGGLSDAEFLRAIYRSGATPFFDVVAVTVDGGESSPFDRAVAEDRQNLSRAVLIREVMLEEGGALTPVWGTRYGWSTHANQISPNDQAAFAIAGLDRVDDEWPWMGLLFAWSYFPTADGGESRSLVADGQATPLLGALTERAETAERVAATGFAPITAHSIELSGLWVDQDTAQGYLSTTRPGSSVTFRFNGSGLITFLRYSPAAGPIRATLDGGPLPGGLELTPDGTATLLSLRRFQALEFPVELARGLPETTHELTLELTGPGELTVGGIVVVRDVPTLWPIVVLAAFGGGLIFLALRELLVLLALRGGLLARHQEITIERSDAW